MSTRPSLSLTSSRHALSWTIPARYLLGKPTMSSMRRTGAE